MCNVLGFCVRELFFLPYYIIGVVTERNGVERSGARAPRPLRLWGLRDLQGSGDRHFVAPLTSFAPLLSRIKVTNLLDLFLLLYIFDLLVYMFDGYPFVTPFLRRYP